MPLFPILDQPKENEQSQQLFPGADVQTDTGDDHVTPGGFDWLSNKSYQSEPTSQTVTQTPDSPVQTIAPPEVSFDSPEHSPFGHTGSKRQKEDKARSGASDEDDEKDSVVKKHRKKVKKEKHKHKSKKHKHRRSRSRSPAAVYSKVTEKQSKVFQHGDKVFIDEIPGMEAEDAYRIDRKPNQNNYIYGSVVDRHVAKFRRHIDICLAAEDQPTVSLRVAKDQGRQAKTHNRYYNRENRKILRSAPQGVLLTNKENWSGADGAKEFIPVNKINPAGKNQEDNLLRGDVRDQLMDVKSMAYVQGAGVVPPEQEDNPIQKSYLWQKNADYNRRLRENPKDVSLWLEFVNFQDRFLYEDISDESHSGSINVKKLPKQVIHEKKVMILQKAMEMNSSCVSLKLRYLELCQNSLEVAEVNKEFESLLFVYPTDTALWRRYLLYNQSHLATFSVTRVCKLYTTCIQKLIGYQEGSVISRGSTEGLDRDMLDLFVQFCCFLRQTGHMEKAVGCFQALIEFNLFCPPSLESSRHQDKQNVFESFWDSGISRVGENNAKGWRYWSEHPEDVHTSASVTLDTDIQQEEQELLALKDPKWRMWLNLELLRESVHLLPWRPDVSKDETEEDCQDMERLVLFDDISGVLFTLPKWLQFEAALQFFLFLGVDTSSGFMLTSVSSVDHQCNLDRVSQIFDKDLIPQCHGNIKVTSLVKTYINSLLEQMITYFDDDVSSHTLLTAMRLRFFKQCIGDSSNGLKQLKKFGKSMLKEARNRSNLYVWSEYTTLLWTVGGPLEARPVVETALSMHSGSGLSVDVDPGTRCGLVRLHRILAEIVLKFPSRELPVCGERILDKESDKSKIEARWGLQCLVKGKNIKDPHPFENPLICSWTMKKMMAVFDSYVENLKSDVCGNSGKCVLTLQVFCEFTRCCVLYAWLTQADLLRESITIVDRALSQVQLLLPNCQSPFPDSEQPRCEPQTSNCLRVLEELHKIKIRMVVCHMSSLSAPLNCLRSAINAALSDFPCNSHFLWLFTQTELKMNVSGRLNRFFSHRLKEGAQPVLLLMAVLSQVKKLRDVEEQLRKDNTRKQGEDGEVLIPETSMIHRIRTYCDVGKDSVLAQNCPLFWRLCLYTEMKYGKRERAKGMFYQALQHCPWAKVLYLDGVSMFGEENLDSVTDLLMEKELRLQIPLEEVDILLE
ncbi:protein NRDE2 homolog [Mizuhopecten yessoensis]|uniref:Protein NRDE2-like n=1 Tax=Mizuhopecten yessoensis TaxID=6573 RepID=A0A210R5T2_MIZYE|nr:protein NRDE2 homolog [Mizuhopecten yessoensis]OWF56409.1 Protein NRDE2-like [Mizuhopecten yessoensis]